MKPNRGSKRVPPGRGGLDSEVVEVTGGPVYHMPVPPAKYRGPLIPVGTGESVSEGVPQRPGPGAFLRKRTPLVPTSDEIRSLPRFARVAFGARCARRVLSAYVAFWVDAPQEYTATLRTAVAVAEQVGAGLNLPEIAKVSEAAYLAAADSPDPAWYAANAAAYASSIAVDPNTIEINYATSNAAHILFETATIDSPLASQLRCIRRDFVRLKKLARKEKWTDDTPVPPEVFGPMWPPGVEPYWAVEPPAALTTPPTGN